MVEMVKAVNTTNLQVAFLTSQLFIKTVIMWPAFLWDDKCNASVGFSLTSFQLYLTFFLQVQTEERMGPVCYLLRGIWERAW